MKLILDEKLTRKGKPVGLPYVGSKKKIAKKIIQIIIQNFGRDKVVYDIFGGGGAITCECLINNLKVIYNDLDSMPMDMIKEICNKDREYLKTLIVSREDFVNIKNKKNKTVDDQIKLLINSFGNNIKNYLYSKRTSDLKFNLAKLIIKNYDCFSGYRQTRTYKNKLQRLQQLERLQQLQGLQQLERLQQLGQLEQLKIYHKDYTYFSNVKNGIFYLDPPYEHSIKPYSAGLKNYEDFYKWCKSVNKNNIVLISGYEMPDDFECVYEFKKSKSTLQSGVHPEKFEKLFMVKHNTL